MQDELDSLVSRLRFRHLRLLVELHRCGTLSKAAATLHLSQPALSKTLKEVEEAFGFPLFRRGAFGSRPSNRFHSAFLFARWTVHSIFASAEVISFTTFPFLS